MSEHNLSKLVETRNTCPGRKSKASTDNIYYFLRAVHGYTTAELAKLVGASAMTINGLEHGRSAKFKVLQAISELFGVSIDDLVRNNVASVNSGTIGSHASCSDAKRRRVSISMINTGNYGEEISADIERKALAGTGYEKYVSTRPAKNRRNGYDVISRTPDGQPKYIEVKTTTAKEPDEPFHMSAAELRKARQLSESGKNYMLYRIYALDVATGSYQYVAYSAKELLSEFDPIPETYLMMRKRKEH